MNPKSLQLIHDSLTIDVWVVVLFCFVLIMDYQTIEENYGYYHKEMKQWMLALVICGQIILAFVIRFLFLGFEIAGTIK